MELKQPKRIIMFNGQQLADLNPTLSVEAVVRMHAAQHPELGTALIEGPTYENSEQVYTCNTRLGTKG